MTPSHSSKKHALLDGAALVGLYPGVIWILNAVTKLGVGLSISLVTIIFIGYVLMLQIFDRELTWNVRDKKTLSILIAVMCFHFLLNILHFDDRKIWQDHVIMFGFFLVCLAPLNLDRFHRMIAVSAAILVTLFVAGWILLPTETFIIPKTGRIGFPTHGNTVARGAYCFILLLLPATFSKTWRYILIAALLGVAIYCQSRTATIAFIAGFATYYLLIHRRPLSILKPTLGKCMVVAAISLIAITFTSEIVSWATRGETTRSLASFTGRTQIWQIALAHISQNIFFGSGFESRIIRIWNIHNNSYYEAPHPHNQLIELVLVKGIVVAVLFFLVAFLAVWYGLKCRKEKSGLRRNWLAANTALCVLVLVTSITESGYSATHAVGAIWYFAMAQLFGPGWLVKDQSAQDASMMLSGSDESTHSTLPRVL